MNLIFKILINGLAVLLTAYLLPGVAVESYLDAILVGLALGIINVFLKPVLVILTLPVTILTLGLFLLVINGALVLLASTILSGFFVSGLIWAILFSIVLSIINLILDSLTRT